ncbi:hypothetical protein [Paenibacillus sp. SI8]|uniref:hypothetical protein n=1 Tax=unclassified Paenibacillus TaxID=185978 RepID=UPI003465E599
MKHFYLKAGLFGLLLLFCILFGVSLATSGVERIQGPLSPSPKVAQEEAAKQKAKATALAAEGAAAKLESQAKTVKMTGNTKDQAGTKIDPVADHDNSLNHVGNKLGSLLQIVAHHGIKLFVSLFDAVLGKG